MSCACVIRHPFPASEPPMSPAGARCTCPRNVQVQHRAPQLAGCPVLGGVGGTNWLPEHPKPRWFPALAHWRCWHTDAGPTAGQLCLEGAPEASLPRAQPVCAHRSGSAPNSVKAPRHLTLPEACFKCQWLLLYRGLHQPRWHVRHLTLTKHTTEIFADSFCLCVSIGHIFLSYAVMDWY